VRHLDTIHLGETPISFLFTPGHTAGGGCYLLSDSLFAGDTVFIEGCGICHARGGSPEEMFNSIQEIKRIVPPHVRVYPGHSFGEKPGRTLHHLVKQNIYFQINKKRQFIDFRMRKSFKKFFDFH
jgi:glyoxylase-like metal-dependent hydrolase (beta-lactamase superfamily II)